MKKFGSVLSIVLTLSIILGNFVLPVFAYEKGSVNLEQIKTEAKTLSNTNGAILNKLNSVSRSTSDSSQYSQLIQKGSTTLEKSQQTEVKKDYVEGEILVKYKNAKINLNTVSGRATALNFIRTKSLEKKEDLIKNNISVLKIKDTKTVEQKIAELKNDPNVEYAQPNFQYYPAEISSNDTNKDRLWGLDNTGQTITGPYGSIDNTYIPITGTPNKDINAPEAWAINEGTNTSTIVAVIDDGVAYNHPDLLGNMWNGNACVGQDSNGNTISGNCNHGYDYEDNDKTPLPTNGSHGTHIAGTIAAVKNNNKGIIGVAPNAKIMALKMSGNTSEVIKSINFAQQNGAKIINFSWASYSTIPGEYYDNALYQAIGGFPGLFISATGNGNNEGNGGFNHEDGIDIHKSYPSGFKITTPLGPGLNNIISVAATDQNDALATFSDYGATSVDVGAPGVNILSTIDESTGFIEDFEAVSVPNIGNKLTQWGSNTWGTLSNGSNKAIFSDYANWGNYQDNISSYLDSNAINLTGKNNSYLNFGIECDTEENYDFMVLAFYNGTEWKVVDDFTGFSYGDLKYNLSDYINSNFKFRFFWYTDESNVGGPYYGCYVDDISITSFSDGSDEKYDYYDGTSMAAPHVAGLAALIEGYNPNLTSSQVKNIILTTGDLLSGPTGLVGKTVSGRRINAFNALNSLVPTTHTISGTIKYYDGVKVIPNATLILENGVGAQIATTTTDINGAYQFIGVTNGGNYVVRVSKDDNFSSTGVNVLDLIVIKKHTLGTELTDIYEKIAADFNSNLSINVVDLIMLKKFTLEQVEGRPTSSWKFYSSNATLTTSNYLTEGLNRTYTNLTDNSPNQDFIGVKMGDVNNSWVSI